jgi:hypothetical protein
MQASELVASQAPVCRGRGRRNDECAGWNGIADLSEAPCDSGTSVRRMVGGSAGALRYGYGFEAPLFYFRGDAVFVTSVTIAPTFANDSTSATLNFTPNSISTATIKLI